MPIKLRSKHLYYGISALVVLAPIIFFPSLISLYRLPKAVFISLFVTGLLWLWLFLLIQEKREQAAFPLATPLILYLTISALSLIQAINPFEGIFALSQKLTYIFLFWLAVNHLKTKEKMEAVLLWNTGVAFVVSLVGIYQSLVGDIPVLSAWHRPPLPSATRTRPLNISSSPSRFHICFFSPPAIVKRSASLLSVLPP